MFFFLVTVTQRRPNGPIRGAPHTHTHTHTSIFSAALLRGVSPANCVANSLAVSVCVCAQAEFGGVSQTPRSNQETKPVIQLTLSAPRASKGGAASPATSCQHGCFFWLLTNAIVTHNHWCSAVTVVDSSEQSGRADQSEHSELIGRGGQRVNTHNTIQRCCMRNQCDFGTLNNVNLF